MDKQESNESSNTHDIKDTVSSVNDLLKSFTMDELITLIESRDKSNIDVASHDFINLIYSNGSFLDNYFPFTYKNKNKLNFFSSLIDLFPINVEDIPKIVTKCLQYFLIDIIKIDKAQHLLKKINFEKILELRNDNLQLLTFYHISGCTSTLPVFLYVDKVFKNYVVRQNHDPNFRSIISAACRNSDFRVLKHIINNFNEYHDPTLANTKYVECMLSQVFSYHIPQKYTLRRIKLLSQKINLAPYFYCMVDYSNDIKLIMILSKYYCKDYSPTPRNINVLTSIISNLEDDNVSDTEMEETMCDIISLIKSKEDKLKVMLNIFYSQKKLYGIDIKKFYVYNVVNQTYIDHYKMSMLESIFSYGSYSDIQSVFNASDLKNVMVTLDFKDSNLLSHNYIRRFLSKNYKSKLFFLMPFINYFPVDIKKHKDKKSFELCISLNKMKTIIKIFLRKKNLVKKLENRIKKARLLNEIENFKPNKGVKVLSRGSLNYQMLTQKFTKVPPRHIYPYDLNNLEENSNGIYIIKEKADGCHTDFIQKDVEPYIEEYTMHSVNAEFIEDLDLYLVYDIDLNNTDYIERYDYLRSLHPYTKDSTIETVSTFDDLKEKVKLERKRLESFLDQPYKNFRVYPKASWIVKDFKSKINSEILENIIEMKDYNFICNEGPYLNDGFVITPFDGSRELKVKPKDQHTVDLYFDGKNWTDRDKKIWENISYDSKFNGDFKDKIWRCYPIFDNDMVSFEPKDYRFEKEKPNPYSVVNNINKLCKVDWKLITTTDYEKNNFYYHNRNLNHDDIFTDLKNKQKEILTDVLERVNPDLNMKWLDLGCGSGKLLKHIKSYNPKEYVGLDFDINQLIQGVKRIDKNQQFMNFARLAIADLNKDWHNHPLAWSSLDIETRFEYIVANFSLTHFYSESFWEKLSNVSKEGTILIFNIVNENSSEKWESNESYLYSKDGITYYKIKGVHDYEMREIFVTESSIVMNCKKFNWEILERLTPSCDSSLTSKYTWYILKHN